jgi:hypothetical protein
MADPPGAVAATPNERLLLCALASGQGRWHTPAELQAGGLLGHRTVDGLHRTAISLVDKGLAERSSASGRSWRYRITRSGRDLLDPGA